MSDTSTLTEFEDATHPDRDVESSSPKSPTDVEIDDVDLPDRDFEWEAEVDQIVDDTLAIVTAAESIPVRDGEFHPHGVGYIAAGLEQYLDEHGDRQLEVPSSLDRPDRELDTYIAELSAKGQSTVPSGERWGTGIPAERLRQAIEFAVDGQSYRASEVEITACGRLGFVVQYRGDAYAVSVTTIGDPGETLVANDVAGLTIENEEDPRVLNGIKVVYNAIREGFDFDITGFQRRTADKLFFETDHPSGKPIEFTGSHLKQATYPTQDLAHLAGEYEYEAWHTDEVVEYEFDPDELRQEPGTFAGHKETKWVLGYRKVERRRTKGLRDSKYGIGVAVLAQPYYLKIRPDAYDNRISTRVYGSNGKERVTKIGFSEPDHRHPEELDDPDPGFRR